MNRILKEAILAPLSYEDYEYEVIVCENKLRVLLVSSPKVDRSACAIGVGVGSMSDFEFGYEGLAHFCEHMLFMGTARFPDEQEYQKYVQQNGGMTNAFTSDMETVYYATIKPEALDGLVDRTAEFFISPAFNAGAVDREVEAVNSEHEKNLQSDGRRKYHLQKFLSNPKHPYSTFSTGSNETLRKLDKFQGDQESSLKALRDKLLEFHAKNYSSNNMACVVIGREPIAELEKMVIPRIEKIVNKNVKIVKGSAVGKPELCFRPTEDLGWQIDVTPVNAGERSLEIRVVVPDQRDYYKSRPAYFLSHILGHEGEGSILSILKARGMATSLMASPCSDNNGQSLFVINIELADDDQFTEENVIFIVKLVMASLMELDDGGSHAGILADLVEDEAKVEKLNWKYRPLFAVDDLVQVGVRSLLAYEPSEVFCGNVINLEIDIDQIRRHIKLFIDSLKKSELLIWRVSTKFETTEVEPVYKTKYSRERLTETCKTAWANFTPEDAKKLLKEVDFECVEKNKYVPERLDLKRPEQLTDPTDPPECVSAVPGLEVWHKFENSFKLPQFTFNGRIILPLLQATKADLEWMSENDVTRAKVKKQLLAAESIKDLIWPARIALYYIYIGAVMESINEQMYDARLAGVIYSLRLICGMGKGPAGMAFSLGGFDDKGPEVMDAFINSTHKFAASDSDISTALTQLITSFTNKCITTDPYRYVMMKCGEAICRDKADEKDILESLQCFTPALVRKFIVEKDTDLKSELFKNSSVVSTTVGNLLSDEVAGCYAKPEIWRKLIPDMSSIDLSKFENSIKYSNIDVKKLDLKLARSVTQGFGVNLICLKQPSLNPENLNGSVLLTIQTSDQTPEVIGFNNLFHIWIGDKFFDDLRTKQTLGYVVGTPCLENGNSTSRGFLVQSVKSTEFVLSRILNFMQEQLLTQAADGSFRIQPNNLPDEEFDLCRNAVISRYEEKPKEIGTLMERIGAELINGRHEFDIRRKVISFLKTYTKAKFIEHLNTAFTGNWLATLIYPEASESFEFNLEDGLQAFPWCSIYVAKKTRQLINESPLML